MRSTRKGTEETSNAKYLQELISLKGWNKAQSYAINISKT